MKYLLYDRVKNKIVNILENRPENVPNNQVVLEVNSDKIIHHRCIRIENINNEYVIKYLNQIECLNKLKYEKIEQLKQMAFNYISEKYPLWKQNNDILDKERIVVELVSLTDSKITSDELRRMIYDILAGNRKEYEVYAYIAKKLGIAELDNNNKVLLTVLFVNGKKKVVNINEIDSLKGQILNVQVMVKDNFKEKFAAIVNLFRQLIDIAKRIYWKDLVRQKVNLIEQKILNSSNIKELLDINLTSFFDIT